MAFSLYKLIVKLDPLDERVPHPIRKYGPYGLLISSIISLLPAFTNSIAAQEPHFQVNCGIVIVWHQTWKTVVSTIEIVLIYVISMFGTTIFVFYVVVVIYRKIKVVESEVNIDPQVK